MAKTSLWRRLEASARTIQDHFEREALPDTLVILGSGFKGFEQKLQGVAALDLAEVEHFPVPKVEGHGVSLVVGKAGNREICVLTGRVHMYEGYDAQEVVYPLRDLSTLGVQRVLLTNAAGSVDPAIRPGQVVAIKDQINLTGRNCLIGGDAAEMGPIFVDMSEVFDPSWRASIMQLEGTGRIVDGVYAGLLGPTYETPAETAMLYRLGINVVGMSTVQEVIAARQLKMTIACLSFVTNMTGGLGSALSHQEVIDLVTEHKTKLHDLLVKAVALA